MGLENRLKGIARIVYHDSKVKLDEAASMVNNELAAFPKDKHKPFRKALEVMLADIEKAKAALTHKEK